MSSIEYIQKVLDHNLLRYVKKDDSITNFINIHGFPLHDEIHYYKLDAELGLKTCFHNLLGFRSSYDEKNLYEIPIISNGDTKSIIKLYN